MTMSKTVKQLVQFLEPLQDDFKCPICYEILQEPHLTTCCGNHHLCKGCMENVKKTNGRCPFCQQNPFKGFIDKRFERQLNDLEVYCIYKSKGCEWIGNFGKIEQHLDIGKENGVCQYVVVECPVSVECKEYILRKDLKNHINNICNYRQTRCMYCEFVSTYQNITTLHITKCTKYPLLCPNVCSDQTYPRNQVSAHLASCPEQEVDCAFSEMGCKEKIKHRVLQEHLDTNLLQHQLIMCQAFKEMKKDKQEVEEQLELLKRDKKELEVKMQGMLKFSNQEDNQMKSLKFLAIEKNQSLYFSKMLELSNLNPVAPLVFKASFEDTRQGHHNSANHYTAQPYKSPFFYSYSNGYKLQLSAEVVCHCSNCVKPQEMVTTAVQIERPAFPIERPAFPIERPPLARHKQYNYVDPGHTKCNYAIRDHARYYYANPDNQPANSLYASHRVETKPSVSVNLYIFKGDHDSQLKWPFKEKVTITTIQGNEYHSIEKIFEGNRNHTSNGIKLGIKSLPKQTETDLITPLPLIPFPSQQEPNLMELDVPTDDAQGYRNEEKQNFSVPTENDLTFPIKIPVFRRSMPQYRVASVSGDGKRNIHNEILFEVTFSPQLLH